MPSPLHFQPYITKTNDLVPEFKNMKLPAAEPEGKPLVLSPAFSSYTRSRATISVQFISGVELAQYVDWSMQPTSLVLLIQLNLLLIRQRWIWIYYHP